MNENDKPIDDINDNCLLLFITNTTTVEQVWCFNEKKCVELNNTFPFDYSSLRFSETFIDIRR